MQITVHDSGMRKVAFIDNEKQGTLNFYNDKWIRVLGAFGSTFEFTVFKKSVKSDLLFEKAYHHLNDRSFISFEFKGKTQLFTVLQTEEDEETIHLYCESPTLELLNEYVGAYKADQAYTFLEYCQMWNMLDFSAINVGINEIKDKELTLEWTGEDTKLKRLMSLANYFEVEIELETRLNFDSTLDQFLINIYKANNGDDIQGLGQRRADVVLEYGKNVERIVRKVDKSNIVNAIKPVGKKEITKKVTTTTPKSRQVVVPASSVRKWTSGNINYAGHTISGTVVQQILDLCISYRVLPSGVISQLYLESFWGASTVGRVDNNWSGMTGGAQTRPSGVKVTTGMARPANEGGTYMHYASVSDFIKDYMFLLAEQKTSSGAKMYGVKGKTNIADYTKGLFRVGGALYDYAAAGYSAYKPLMENIRRGVNSQTKGSMDLLDKLFMQGGVTSSGAPRTTVTKKATATENALNKVKALKGHRVGSGQCYALSAYYANILGGPGLGGGVTSLRGLIGGGIRASHIGEDYAWSNYGWSVVRPTSVGQLKAGGIANIKPNLSYLGTGYYGHTVIIKSVNAKTITVYEQNYNGKQYVIENSYSTNAYLGAIQTVVYPKEITQGAIVGGIATTTNDDGTVTTTEYYSETTVEEVKETVDLYISDTNKQKWLTEDGELEFYIKNGMLFAPISKQMYPSVLSGTETTDNWIRRDIEVETDQESVLIATALREMRKNAYPAITYELQGWFDGEIGDTLDIRDTGFVPTLLLNARIYRQEICFTQPETSRTEFANFKELENMISSGLMSDWERMAEEAKPYELHIATDNGTSFKNNTGTSLLTTRLEKGGREIDDAIIFYKVGDAIVGSGASLSVNATDFDKVWPVTIEAYVNEQLVASRQLTFIDVEDGKNGLDGVDGLDGKDGLQGPPGVDGKTFYTHIAYANSADGVTGFSTSDGLNKTYIGMFVDEIQADSTDPSKYTWTLIKGADGAQGIAGTKGADGKTPYFHTAWATNATGTTGFSVTESTGKTYLGTYTDYVQADSTDPTKYKWVLIQGPKGDKGDVGPQGPVGATGLQGPKGDQGIQGPVGADGKSSYTHIAYATNSTGTSGFSVSDNVGKTYIGMYVDQIATDSTDPSKYKWNLIKGADGAQGIQGPKGADGLTPYWHTAYANSADGKTGFSVTDSTNKQYIGQYTDYTATDSTDPTKYKWVNMVGTVTTGNRNFLAQNLTVSKFSSKDFTTKAWGADYINATNTATFLKSGETYTVSFDAEIVAKSTIATVNQLSVGFLLYSASTGRNVDLRLVASKNNAIQNLNQKGRFEMTFVCPELASDHKITVYTNRYYDGTTADNDTVKFTNVNWTLGNVVSKSWIRPIEDIDDALDSKADDALTTEQLQALADAQRIADADLKGKADIATVEAWVQALNDEIEARKSGQASSEQALIDASNRVIALQQQMGEMQVRTDFVNTYMSESENGLVIGMKDGSSSVRVSNDRISFYSAGKETAYISQGVLQIESGIFTTKLQIGRFRIEQYEANPDMNVVRYVG